MPSVTVTTDHSRDLVMILSSVNYNYDPSGWRWWDYCPDFGLPPAYYAPGWTPPGNYYQDSAYWRLSSNQGDAATFMASHARPDSLPNWAWGFGGTVLTAIPGFPTPDATNRFIRMQLYGRIGAGSTGREPEVPVGHTLTADMVRVIVKYPYIAGPTIDVGVAYRDNNPGRHFAWSDLICYPDLSDGGGTVPLVSRFSVAAGVATREFDFSGTWLSILTGDAPLSGADLPATTGVGVRFRNPSLSAPGLPLISLQATRLWTTSVTTTAPEEVNIESEAETGSAVATRVSGTPRGPVGMMGAVRLTRVLQVAPPAEPERTPLTRPRIEES